MESYAMYPLADLRRRRQLVVDELKAICPEQMQLLQSLEVLIRAAEEGVGTTYRDTPGVIEAMELCLNLNAQWMTKAEMLNHMIAGGYPFGSKAGRLVINQAVQYHRKTGRLATVGDRIGRGVWVNDPNAPQPPKIIQP